MFVGGLSVEELIARGSMNESPELRLLFHRLNNQLGIILANAELIRKTLPAAQTAAASRTLLISDMLLTVLIAH